MATFDYKQFLEDIPLAYYRLNAQDEIEHVNRAWLDLRGYASLEDVRGEPIREIGHVRPWDTERIQRKLQEDGVVADEINELKRPNGSRFWASVHATAIYDEGGAYIGRQGFVIDITERHIHHTIADSIPIAFFAVAIHDEHEEVIYCNPHFVKMFGFANVEEALTTSIGNVYGDPKEYKKFFKYVKRTTTTESIYRQKYVKKIGSNNRNDEQFLVEAQTKIVRDQEEKAISRIGMLRDLRDENILHHLGTDLGNVLHTFSSALISLEHDIKLAQTMIRNVPVSVPFVAAPEQTVWEQQKPHVRQLEKSLAQLLPALKTAQYALLFADFEPFTQKIADVKAAPVVFRPRTMYDVAAAIVEKTITALLQKDVLVAPIAAVQAHAYNVMRVFTLDSFQSRLIDVTSLDTELRSFRDFIQQQTGLRTEGKLTKVNLLTLVKQAARDLYSYADARRIDIRLSSKMIDGDVIANERGLLRVFTNVLHNAIKYSWSGRYKNLWINITIYEEGSEWIVEIENFGIPIPKDDLQSGAIFDVGYRSSTTRDKDRVGTGFGLSDAKSTLNRYKGRIWLTSEPASRGGRASGNDPFITKAFIALPKAKNNKDTS